MNDLVFKVDVDEETLKQIEVDLYNWDFDRIETENVYLSYQVDVPEEVVSELIAEYPNGGKEYRDVILKEESGHFDIFYENGLKFPYQLYIPDYVPKDDSTHTGIAYINYWRKLTEEELAQKEQEQEEEAKKLEATQDFMQNGPDKLKALEEAQDDIILLLADIVGGAV